MYSVCVCVRLCVCTLCASESRLVRNAIKARLLSDVIASNVATRRDIAKLLLEKKKERKDYRYLSRAIGKFSLDGKRIHSSSCFFLFFFVLLFIIFFLCWFALLFPPRHATTATRPWRHIVKRRLKSQLCDSVISLPHANETNATLIEVGGTIGIYILCKNKCVCVCVYFREKKSSGHAREKNS